MNPDQQIYEWVMSNPLAQRRLSQITQRLAGESAARLTNRVKHNAYQDITGKRSKILAAWAAPTVAAHIAVAEWLQRGTEKQTDASRGQI